ncbi:MAG: gamma-glutamyl-phosphate reductase, partial [Clostridia bacterium]|nr:gamma-glutamyl-phosphate reductase [Clostridia bacterium]
MIDLNLLGEKAKVAASALNGLSQEKIDRALKAAAKALTDNADSIISANAKDVIAARKKGLSAAFIDRLTVSGKTL